MRILLAGDQEHLAPILSLLANTHDRIVIVDEDRRECEALAEQFDRVVIHGDPTDADALAEAHIRHFDLVLALTDRMADNLRICRLAKERFGVRRMLASSGAQPMDADAGRGPDQQARHDGFALAGPEPEILSFPELVRRFGRIGASV